MKKRNFYNRLFAKYPDVVNLKQLREMLGGISEGTALKLMQENKIKHYKVKYQYRIPKKWVIDYIMSDEYEEYNPALMFQNLMLSEEFRLEFIRACCDVNNIYFSAGRTADMLKEMRAQYEPYVPDSLRRFNDRVERGHGQSRSSD